MGFYPDYLEGQLEELKTNPVAVMLNMMHGKIAHLTFDQWQKVTGDMRYGLLPEKELDKT